jgi:hypothetical protein
MIYRGPCILAVVLCGFSPIPSPPPRTPHPLPSVDRRHTGEIEKEPRNPGPPKIIQYSLINRYSNEKCKVKRYSYKEGGIIEENLGTTSASDEKKSCLYLSDKLSL